jgi:ABC-type multidrug transport system permease subunit
VVTLLEVIVVLVALIIIWVIVSLPVYAAAKAVTSGKATLGEAMVATLGGAIVYVIVLVGVTFFLRGILGNFAGVIAFILAFIAWLAVYKSSFETSWLGALGIAILAAIIVFIINIVLVALFGVAIPSYFHPF